MKNAIFVKTDTGQHQKPKNHLSQGKTIAVGNKEWLIERVIDFKSDSDNLSSFLKEHHDKELTLIFESFTDLKKDIDLLKLIKGEVHSFQFQDLPNVDSKKTLSALISFLELEYEQKSRKIRVALKKKKQEGGAIGNKDIGRPEGKAIRRRQLEAYRNIYNKIARKRIHELKNERNLNYNQIAHQLNEEGLKPRRGKKFHARTVMRLEESKEKLNKKYQHHPDYKKQIENNKDRFKPNSKIELFINGDRNAPLAETQGTIRKILVNGLKNEDTFEKVFSFSFKEPIPDPFMMSIIDNEGRLVLKHDYPPFTTEIRIDLEEEGLFGLHYLAIRPTGKNKYEPLVIAVRFMKSILKEE